MLSMADYTHAQSCMHIVGYWLCGADATAHSTGIWQCGLESYLSLTHPSQ